MSFFKNINATPRIGSVIMNPNGFSIYTDGGWQEYNENDILDIIDNARVVERVDGSHTDIDDIFGQHISNEATVPSRGMSMFLSTGRSTTFFRQG